MFRTFNDPEEYAGAIRSLKADITVTKRGHFGAKVWTVDFRDLWMLRLSEDLPQTMHLDGFSGTRTFIMFRTQPGLSLVNDGRKLHWGTISRPGIGKSFYQHTFGPTAYGSMSLPNAMMATVSTAMTGRDLTIGDDLLFQPPAEAMARLQRLHETAGHLAEDTPWVLRHPEAARGLEQALIEAMMHCLGDGETHEDRAAQRQHAAIMRRFRRVIEEHLNDPLYIPELCREIGTSQRTLNTCCQEHLGMGAKHYLLLRRMNMVRRALRDGSLGQTTITETAMEYGFWQLGRFAAEYKALFGEVPSATVPR